LSACFFCSVRSLQETYEKKKQEHVAEMQKKEEDMRQMFVVRVKEKESELKEAEKEVREKTVTAYDFYSSSHLFPMLIWFRLHH